MKINRIIIVSIILLLVSCGYLYGQEHDISKATAIDIAAKEAHERNYNIYIMYVLKDETLWGKFPKFYSFRNKDFTEINNSLKGRKYWDIYLRVDPRITDNDIAIFIDSMSGEIISIYGNNVREKTKSYHPETAITIGKAVEIADAAAKRINYSIDNKRYLISYNTTPWYDFPNNSTIFKRKYPDKYNYFYQYQYWVIEYLNIRPSHDGGLKVYVNSETGDPFLSGMILFLVSNVLAALNNIIIVKPS